MAKTGQWWMLGIAFCVVLSVAYVWWLRLPSDQVSAITWRLSSTSEPVADFFITRTTVALQTTKADDTLGTYDGNCWEVTSQQRSDAGEYDVFRYENPSWLAEIRCWWAGAGDQLIAVKESDRVVVLHRALFEPGPDACVPECDTSRFVSEPTTLRTYELVSG